MHIGSSKTLGANLLALKALESDQLVGMRGKHYFLMNTHADDKSFGVHSSASPKQRRARGLAPITLVAATGLVVCLVLVGNLGSTSNTPKSSAKESLKDKPPSSKVEVETTDCSNRSLSHIDFAGVSVSVSNAACGVELETRTGSGEVVANHVVQK